MNLLASLRSYVIGLVPNAFKHAVKIRTSASYRKDYEVSSMYEQVRKIPRYTRGSVTVSGLNLEFVDSPSFIFTYEEIFRKEIYKFHSSNPTPHILDAGANIGLSVLYFKRLFPKAVITAFEPDDQVFGVLSRNVQQNGLTDVQLVKKGLWTHETELSFMAEGADGGRIAGQQEKANIVTIQTVKLSDYLKHHEVDLLKMDIEGAEFDVLKEAEAYLGRASRIFVEYHSFTGKEQCLSELLLLLKNQGFRVFISSPGLVSQNPFVHVNTYNGMDMQLNIYGIRG